ncbi:MAG TPA: SRPBCC domain-containing protein [Puia sp.]
MAKQITQKIIFKKTKPKQVFDLYMDAKKHALISGSPVIISSKAGSAFAAHQGYITGQSVYTVKDKIIVQTWRAVDWDASDPDSTFTIVLEPKGKDTVLHAIHSNVPEKHAAGIEKGWHGHYWKPWKQHLSGKKIKRPAM